MVEESSGSLDKLTKDLLTMHGYTEASNFAEITTVEDLSEVFKEIETSVKSLSKTDKNFLELKKVDVLLTDPSKFSLRFAVKNAITRAWRVAREAIYPTEDTEEPKRKQARLMDVMKDTEPSLEQVSTFAKWRIRVSGKIQKITNVLFHPDNIVLHVNDKDQLICACPFSGCDNEYVLKIRVRQRVKENRHFAEYSYGKLDFHVKKHHMPNAQQDQASQQPTSTLSDEDSEDEETEDETEEVC